MHREFDPERMGFGHVYPPHHERGAAADHHHHRHHGHDHHHDHDHDHAAELRTLVATTCVVGFLIVSDLLLATWGDAYRRPFGVSPMVLAAIIGGGRVVYLALAALFEGRIGADIALAIACIAAAVMREYFVAAEVVFIALVGECLEALTFDRAQRAITRLLEYRPRTARVLRDDREVEIAAEALAIGDVLVVRPGERIAADGKVLRGRSAVDQAVLTGESLPVDKGEGDQVFTGTVNQFGRLEVEAEKVGDETTLGRVIRLLADARRHRSPLERTADRYARLFLPAVLIAATVVFLGTNFGVLWNWGRTGAIPRIDVMPALAVLVVACPCALILATPAAVLAATARLARRGVLIKGGDALERLSRVDAVAFDKTGTLTEGRPEIGDRIPRGDWTADELLRLAAAAEQPSEHPLARLLVAEARDLGLKTPRVEDFEAQPGAGIAARIDDEAFGVREVLVGNARLFRERGIALPEEIELALTALDESGQTALLVAVNGEVAGAIGARDRVRIEAHDVIHDLKHLGLKDLTILTGDRVAAARVAAKKVHIKTFESELSPADKAEWVRRRQLEGRVVAMIGDGINDAPALATADVGIALGGVGSDIAAEAGSILLMGDPLEPLPETFQIARSTMRVIRQNIVVFAFGLNGVAIALAGLRILGPVAAAILHQAGSLLVLLNAVRLLGFDRLSELGAVRALLRFATFLRGFRPSVIGERVWNNRRIILRTSVCLVIIAYVFSGLTVIAPGRVGAVRRWGRFEPPLLAPGLHLRLPAPIERVTTVEPDFVRTARVGLLGPNRSQRGPVAWNASHGVRRDESALFFTGDENLVELAGVVEYHYTEAGVRDVLFGVVAVDSSVSAAAEGVFREAAGRTPLEAILVGGRREFEAGVAEKLRARLAEQGIQIAIDRVRVVDAHPPREVVPAYRDVSAAVSDVERYRNDAEAFASERHWSAIAESTSLRDSAGARSQRLKSRAGGAKKAFLARVAAYTARPELTEFQLLWDTLAVSFAGRPKLILDPRAEGRRRLWLADPERAGLGKAALTPEKIPLDEPDD